jgi:hypothetical protein
MSIRSLSLFLSVTLLIAFTTRSEARETGFEKRFPALLKSLYLDSLKGGLSVGVPRFELTILAPSKRILKEVKGLAKRKGGKGTVLCFVNDVESGKGAVAQLVLSSETDKQVVSAFIPQVTAPGVPSVYVDLKAAGLTKSKKRLQLNLTENKELLDKVLAKVRQGYIELRFRLKEKVKRAAEPTIATIQTNKGAMRLQLLDEQAKLKDNKILVTTNDGTLLAELPLGVLPEWREVLDRLTYSRTVRRTIRVKLSAGGNLSDEFLLWYPIATVDLGAKLTKSFGAVGLNSKGEVITHPKLVSFSASVSIQKRISKRCDFLVGPGDGIGSSFLSSPFSLIHQDERDPVVKVFEFDPTTEELTVTFDKTTRPSQK